MPDQTPKKPKRKRTVPRNITEKTDHEVMETIFGKRIMREVDKIVPPPKVSESEEPCAMGG